MTQYYLDEETGTLYASPSQSIIDSKNLTLITAEQANAILNPPPTFSDEYNLLINKYKIDTKELSETFGLSELWDGTTMEAKQSAIQSDANELKTKFFSDLAALKIKHGV